MRKCKSDSSLCGMQNGLYNSFFSGSVAPSVTFDFGGASTLTGARGFRIQYRTSDFSYQTVNANWTDTDTETFKTGANVIDVQTVIPNDNTIACTGAAYYIDGSGNADMVGFGRSAPGSTTALFFDRTMLSQQFVTSNANQAFAVDAINQRVLSWITAPNRIQVRDFSDNIIETLNINSTSLAQGMIAYNYYTGDLYLTSETSANRVERFRKVGSEWVLQEQLWYLSIDGISYDPIFHRIVNFPASGASCTFRYQSLDGKSRIKSFNTPLNPGSVFNTEGLVIDPRDGTIWMADPSNFNIHGNITNGSRGWHLDPEKLYLKYINFPHMVPLTKFKHNGTITGQLNQQQIVGASSVTFPVLNFTGFTNQQNASAWQDMDGVVLDGLEFRGSNTAPTTAELTAVACDVEYFDANGTNDGWGATTPGAWQSTPPSLNYVQARKTAPQSSVADRLSPEDIVSGLGSDLKTFLLFYDDKRMYVDFNSTSPTNQISLAVNQVNPLSNFSQSSSSFRFSYNVPGLFSEDQNANQFLTGTVADFSSQTQGQLTVVTRRAATTSLLNIFDLSTSGSNNNRMVIKWHASSGTPASEINIEESDGTGTVIHRVGVAKTDIVHKQIDIRCDASTKTIRYARADQTLNVSVGTNNGRWFSSISAPNAARIGIANGTTNVGQYKLWIYLSAPATGAVEGNIHTRFPSIVTKQDLIDAFIDQEGLLL